MKEGFFRVAACVPPVTIGDPAANAKAIIQMTGELYNKGVELAVFPELSITGYTCGDLFHNDLLLTESRKALSEIAEATAGKTIAVIVGVPKKENNRLYNMAAVIYNGNICLEIPKTYLPNYNEFYEKRLWSSGKTVNDTAAAKQLFTINGVTIGVEICEDLWVPIPPSSHAALAGAQVIANLSASPDSIGKYHYLRNLIAQQSARCICGYVYASAGFGESSTDLVFDGKAIIAENGKILASNKRWQNESQYVITDIDIAAINRDRLHADTFSECADYENTISLENTDLPLCNTDHNQTDKPLYRHISPLPFVPDNELEIDDRCDEIINIQVAGLAQRLNATKCKTLIIGISGGLDSTLALLIASRAFDRLKLPRKGIIGVTMPGFGTTGRTHSNALTIMESLGVTSREIPIGPAVKQHFADIGHDQSIHDVTYENSQARERTQILMDLANKENGMVLGTGDLSELALGWATYNGDQMSMYGVNASVPKTLVKYLVRWFAMRSESHEMAKALNDIIDTPISPELLPADSNDNIVQRTEDLVGPYELHDFFLYYTLRYGFSPRRIYFLARHAFADYDCSDATIIHWLRTFFRRFFNQQFKRSCMPDGPKVGSVCLSPRGDWRMPSDASSALWLREIDELEKETLHGKATSPDK